MQRRHNANACIWEELAAWIMLGGFVTLVTPVSFMSQHASAWWDDSKNAFREEIVTYSDNFLPHQLRNGLSDGEQNSSDVQSCF